METVRFLREHGLEKFVERFAVRVKEYPGLLHLSYDEHESPKSHPITIECRALTLRSDTFDVVSRTMDRCFGFGEVTELTNRVKVDRSIVLENVDGAFFKVYWCPTTDRWEIGSRTTAFGEDNGFATSVLAAMGFDRVRFQDFATRCMSRQFTYSFVHVDPDRRIVTRYPESMAVLVGARRNIEKYDEAPQSTLAATRDVFLTNGMHVRLPKTYEFTTMVQAIEAMGDSTSKGFIVRDPIANLRMKVRNERYSDVLRARRCGLTPHRSAEMVLSGKHMWYLREFEEDEPKLKPWIDGAADLEKHMDDLWAAVSTLDGREFAVAVTGSPAAHVMFEAKKNAVTPVEVFHCMAMPTRVKILEEFVDKKEV